MLGDYLVLVDCVGDYGRFFGCEKIICVEIVGDCLVKCSCDFGWLRLCAIIIVWLPKQSLLQAQCRGGFVCAQGRARQLASCVSRREGQ